MLFAGGSKRTAHAIAREAKLMIRKMLRTVGIAALAVVTAGAVAEAAATTHRVRHSSRVTVGSSAVKNQTVRKTRHRAGKRKTTVSATTTFKRRTTTKPR
jgi:hypothetical protein